MPRNRTGNSKEEGKVKNQRLPNKLVSYLLLRSLKAQHGVRGYNLRFRFTA